MAVIHAFLQAITTNLEEGVGFESDYLTLSQSMAGVFVDEDEELYATSS